MLYVKEERISCIKIYSAMEFRASPSDGNLWGAGEWLISVDIIRAFHPFETLLVVPLISLFQL